MCVVCVCVCLHFIYFVLFCNVRVMSVVSELMRDMSCVLICVCYC